MVHGCASQVEKEEWDPDAGVPPRHPAGDKDILDENSVCDWENVADLEIDQPLIPNGASYLRDIIIARVLDSQIRQVTIDGFDYVNMKRSARERRYPFVEW